MNKFFVFLPLFLSFDAFSFQEETYTACYYEEILITSDAAPHKVRKKLAVIDLSGKTDDAEKNVQEPQETESSQKTDQKELA